MRLRSVLQERSENTHKSKLLTRWRESHKTAITHRNTVFQAVTKKAIEVMTADDDPVLYFRENTIGNSDLYKPELIL